MLVDDDISDQFWINESIFWGLKEYNSHQTEVLSALRKSPVYRAYIDFVKDQGLDRSGTLGMIPVKKNKDDDGIKLYPFIGPYFSDRDVVLVLTRYFLGEGLKACSLDVAQLFREEMTLRNSIPIMMLDKTSLDLTYNQRIVPPLNAVWGNASRFIDRYRPYCEGIVEKYDLIIKYKEEFKDGQYGNKFTAPQWVTF